MRSYILFLAFTGILLSGCKKNDSNVANKGTKLNYRPHMITGYDGLVFFDASDPTHPKEHVYTYNDATGKYEFSTINDSTDYNIYSTFPHDYYTKWPKNVTDPLIVDASLQACGTQQYGDGLAFIDWNVQDTGYFIYDISYNPFVTGIKTFTFGKSFCSIPMYESIFSGTFGANLYPGKIDGFVDLFEENVIVDSSRTDYAWPEVMYYFDFDAGTFFSDQIRDHGYNGGVKNTDYLISGYISTLIEKPYGNMTTNPIDFKLADAVVLIPNNDIDPYNTFYFFDYDQEKYVEVRRNIKNAGNINQVNTDSAKFNLVTPTWQPISKLITGWEF